MAGYYINRGQIEIVIPLPPGCTIKHIITETTDRLVVRGKIVPYNSPSSTYKDGSSRTEAVSRYEGYGDSDRATEYN